MPRVGDDLGSDAKTVEIQARSSANFRPIVGLGFLVIVVGAAAFAATEKGFTAWGLVAVGIVAGIVGLRQWRKERTLIAGSTSTVATVIEWNQSEGIEGGHVYSVKYRFRSMDGRSYGGSGNSHDEFPREGEKLPILYRSDDPHQNLPMATFWFYEFTYTGFSKWQDTPPD